MRLKYIIMYIFIIFTFFSISACTDKETEMSNQNVNVYSETAGENETKISMVNAYNLFTDYGVFYFINNKNELCDLQKNIILTDIIQVFDGVGGTFAIDKNGDAWGWYCDWLDSTVPQKIEGLRNVKSIVSGFQMENESNIGASYSLFLLDNGELFVAGNAIDKSKKNFPNHGVSTSSYTNIFQYNTPTQLKYDGKAKNIFAIENGDFAILMENDDLYNVNFKNNKRKIEQTFILKGFKDLMTLDKFNIEVTDDGYYGWGSIICTIGDESENYFLKEPTKLAGMDSILACSNTLVAMKDGTLWLRKNTGNMTSLGKLVQEIEDVIRIQGGTVITSQGIIYSVSNENPIIKLADTGFYFPFDKSKEKYNFNINDDFWKYGGYTQ